MNINELLDQAETHHRAGSLEKAIEAYRAILKVSPDNADGHYGLGTALTQINRNTEALPHLVSATQQLPKVPEFQFNLALCLFNLGRTSEAKDCLLQAATLAGRNLYFLMPVCRKMIEQGLAGQAYSILDAIGDKSPQIVTLKARALGACGDWQGAIKLLEALAAENLNDGTVWYEHAKASGYLHDYETAIASFERYLASKEPSGEDYLKFADLLLTARKPEQAKSALDYAINTGVDKADAYHLAAKCARLAGNEGEVRRLTDMAIERRPTFGHAWQLKSEVTALAELSALAEKCIVLAKEPTAKDWDQIMLEYTAGRAFEKSGYIDDAFASFKRANALHKVWLSKRNHSYDREATELEHSKIVGHFPVGGTFSYASKPQTQCPIFILGMPRSGTTLVEKILACLDGVIAGGENEALEYVAGQYYWDLAQGRMLPPQELDGVSLSDMADAYWQKTSFKAPIVTDKMPHNFRHVGLIAQMFPDAKVVFMKRDPRDVCLSIFSRPFPEAHRFSCDLNWLAHFYAENMRLKDHWKAAFPNRVLEVIYEDLVEDPVQQTKQIAEHCGLEWHAGCLDFHKKKDASFTFSELQVRKPLNAEGVGRWRSYDRHLKPLEDALIRYGVL